MATQERAMQRHSEDALASANNRRARFYTLARTGRGHLTEKTSQWRKLAAAMGRVLGRRRV